MECGVYIYIYNPFVVFPHHFQMCEHEKYITPSPTLFKKANSWLCLIYFVSMWDFYFVIPGGFFLPNLEGPFHALQTSTQFWKVSHHFIAIIMFAKEMKGT